MSLLEKLNLSIPTTSKQVVVFHDSPLHYHNVPIEVEIETEDVNLFEEVKGTEKPVKFEVSKGKIKWNVSDPFNKTYLIKPKKFERIQEKAEVGKPVNWALYFENITINYQTPSPVKEDTEIEYNDLSTGIGYGKKIVISHSNDDTHYQNVLVSTKLPDDLQEKDAAALKNWVFVKWINGSIPLFNTSTDITNDPIFNVSFIDTNNDGFKDTVVWNVPILSDQEFEMGIYTCQNFSDSVVWNTVGTTNYFEWNLDNQCPGLAQCFIQHISVYWRLIAPGQQDQSGSVKFNNSQGTWYSPVDASILANAQYGPRWDCNDSYSPDNTLPTCNLTESDYFNESSYWVQVYGSAVGSSKGVVDVYTANYTWCWVKAEPQLKNGTVKPVKGGWGETFDFNVTVKDPQGDDVNVTAWWNHTYAGTYERLDNVTCTSCSSWTNVTVNYSNFACSDIDTDVYYKFTAVDNSINHWNSTWGPYTDVYFEIEKDDVSVNKITPAADLTINRSQTTNFVIRAYDSDAKLYPSGSYGKIWLDDYTYGSWESDPGILSTNSTGHLVRTFLSSDWCTDTSKWYLGEHSWYGGIDGDGCLKDNTTSATNFTLLGSLYNTLNQPGGSQNFTQESTVNFQADITDDCGISRTADSTIVIKMIHGSDEFSCIASASGECGITTNLSFPTGWYNTTIESNKTNHNNGSSFNENVFYLNPLWRLDNQQVDPTSDYYPHNNWNFSVEATSGNTVPMDIKIFLKKGAGEFAECPSNVCVNQTSTKCVNCINDTIYWYRNFTELDTGTWFYQMRMINNNTGQLETQTSGTDSFDVNMPPPILIYLENVTQNPALGQWGGTAFTFNVTVNTKQFSCG